TPRITSGRWPTRVLAAPAARFSTITVPTYPAGRRAPRRPKAIATSRSGISYSCSSIETKPANSRRCQGPASTPAWDSSGSQPFFSRLVPELSRLMGDAYPELPLKQDHVMRVLLAEEERFAETLEHGMKVLEAALADAAKTGTKTLSGETAFTLYDTYGFPFDL